MSRLTTGTWGGAHIRVDVSRNGATVEYDCANGTIKGPLTFDRSGRFSWEGNHIRERGGPIRMDDNPQGVAVVYSGFIKDNIMTLRVKLKDSNDSLGEFTLERGGAGRLFKCR
jgi:hypothetical protein